MKIALASDWFLPRIGGLELQMRDLALRLIAAGHEVEVITATEGAPVVDGIPVHRIDARPLISYGQLSWRPKVARQVEARLVAGGYDVVHCHSALSPMSLMTSRAARRLGIPNVLTEHSVTHGAGGVIMGSTDRLTGWSRWPDVMTGVSSEVVAGLSSLFRRRVRVLHNGVDPADWHLADQDRTPVRVVTVMRMTPRKQPIDFIRAVPKVLAQVPKARRPEFVMIGDGPERARVLAEARRLGVLDAVHFTGLKDREAVRAELAASSVFALPTEKEALSIASLEALSSGLPVVAMGQGGVRDVVTHGETGFLAADADEFAGAIARLVVDDDLRRAMAARGPEAAHRFEWPAILERHVEIYELAITTVARRKRAAAARAERARAARAVPTIDPERPGVVS